MNEVTEQPDFEVTSHGSLYLVTPLNGAAKEHLDEHTSPEALWWAGGLVVEPRYAHSLVAALQDEGFLVH